MSLKGRVPGAVDALGAAAAVLAAPAFDTFLGCDAGDHERGGKIGAPPADASLSAE